MDQKLLDCLEGRESRQSILPFFWQHGEDHHTLRQEIEAMEAAGVRAFCVESRTHADFCKEAWWEDMGFLLAEAKKRDMRVWLLDDKYFPTGYADDYISSHPALKKLTLRMQYADFCGPRTDAAVILPRLAEGESFVAVLAYRREEKGRQVLDDCMDLTGRANHGLLFWDIPAGAWRVYYVIRSLSCPIKPNYIDMLSPDSCKAMLHAVYEPHYAHFGEYFGSTFAGFFSDEPSFFNEEGTYYSTLGREDVWLPWRDDLPERIGAAAGCDAAEARRLLPALWQDIKGRSAQLRTGYMETVTRLYSENFTYMLGDWCRAHGVEYIGHIIEDMNTHQRLGHGPGHYFRALEGQDMAGVDIVLNQMIPGFTDLDHTANVFGRTADPAFFNYALAKLCSSLAHITPRMKNRAMCEIFGAFGWAEGLPMMRRLADHFLACGVNVFVPHAYSPKYPDGDCPPHFYARGQNPQHPLFGKLLAYMRRCSHLLTEGTHVAQAAVLYNAEAEWAGGRLQFFQEAARALTRAQIDFDILPADALAGARVQDGRLALGGETYKALVAPYAQFLPFELIARLDALQKAGLPVYFTEGRPDAAAEGKEMAGLLEGCPVLSLEALPAALRQAGFYELTLSPAAPLVRYYHIRRAGRDIYMFVNEDIFHPYDGWAELEGEAAGVFYDAMENRLLAPVQEGRRLRLRLEKGGSILFITGQFPDGLPAFHYADGPCRDLQLSYTISLKETGKDADFKAYKQNAPLCNLARELPRFSGEIQYETSFTADRTDYTRLELGEAGETAEVWLGGVYLGFSISEPYGFDITGRLLPGENRLVVRCVSNPGYRERDGFSELLPLPPLGLQGPVRLRR